MKILWVSGEEKDIGMVGGGFFTDVQHSVFENDYPEQIDLLIVCANGRRGAFARRDGLEWLLRFRRKTRSTAPALVYSFEKREALAKHYSVISTDIPGVGFLRLPFNRSELETVVGKLKPLLESELDYVLRWHSGLQREWFILAHKFSGALKRYPESVDDLRLILSDWSATIEAFAPDQRQNLDRLRRTLDELTSGDDAVHVKRALQTLDAGLQRRIVESEEAHIEYDSSTGYTYDSPPLGFTKVLIADDQGYDDSTVRDLTLLGYELIATPKNLSQAERDLHYGKPHIVLADLNYPTEREGRRLMQLALKERSVRLVVCISKALVNASELPQGVINCSGTVNSRNAKLIHQVIWLAAREEGVIDTAGRSRAEDCRARLESLLQKINWYIGAWREFPVAITKVIDRAQHVLATAETEGERTTAQAVIDSLSPFASGEQISLGAIKALNAQMPTLWGLAKRRADTEQRGWLYNELHNRISQYLPLVNIGICLDNVRLEIEKINRLPEPHRLSDEMRNQLESTRVESLTLPPLESLSGQLAEVLKSLPKATRPLRRVRGKPLVKISSQHFRIVIVEDNKAWQQFALGAVQKLKEFLASDYPDSPYRIEVATYNNVADALEALKPEKTVFSVEDTSSGPVKTIALVDLGLPANREEAERVVQSTGADAPQPDRRNGKELIRVLRSYGFDIPVIVLTTSKDSIDDVQDICSLGIEDCDYISKSLSNEEELVNRLFNLIESGPRHRIEMVEGSADDDEEVSEDLPIFRIDGIDINLSKTLAEVFYFIFELNLQYRQATLGELSKQLEREMTAIQKDVSQIRKRIKEAFDSVHRKVGKEEIIKTISASSKEDSAYKLQGDLVIKDDEESLNGEASEKRSFKVLVVENEQHHLEYIARLLRSAGFSVQTATNVEDAVLTAEQYRPDVLSLDLHIPYTREQYLEDSLAGDAAAGIVALESIRQRLPNIRVLVPTTNYDRDDLLKQAANLDVPSSCFVRKGPAVQETWGSDLLTTANRLRLELRENRVLPPPSWSAPIIRVLKGSDFRKGVLRLQVNGSFYKKGSSNQGRLLAILIESANRIVTFKEIDHYVSKGRKAVSDDARDGWLKNVRQDIREHWLHLPNDFEGKPERKILESVDGGLVLHAFVESTE